MCLTCGCDDEQNVRISAVYAGRDHHTDRHGHESGLGQTHDHPPDETVRTENLDLDEQILAKNDHLAEHNRSWLRKRGITTVNVMSSPGSGKTSLLERTIAEISTTREVCVIEGDQETEFDAERIRAAGARAVQVNTGAGCHLDAPMVQRAIDALDPTEGSLLFIENVGNLVCPALFDLGETARVVVISVTEGQDKPLKYPHMFAAADLVVINKSDLLPYVDFDVEQCMAYARQIKPGMPSVTISATTDNGLDPWYRWLSELTP